MHNLWRTIKGAIQFDWLINFMWRYRYHIIKMSGEAVSANAMSPEWFIEPLKVIIEERGYSVSIWIKGLFLRRECQYWAFISCEEKMTPGFNDSGSHGAPLHQILEAKPTINIEQEPGTWLMHKHTVLLASFRIILCFWIAGCEKRSKLLQNKFQFSWTT